ncbi:MAG: SCO family protein [Gemmatimonadota bacterium]|nr:SCO family protein [Gemmatimonadota bacterium]MDE2870889.1 SCO family protein [Gemmatimonadota bacterium]
MKPGSGSPVEGIPAQEVPERMVGRAPGAEGRSVDQGAPSPAAVRGAMIGLMGLIAITVAWWALALWPVEGVPPAWLERARAVCFNAGPSGLPDASGWLLLVGQPIGMLAVLMVIAGDGVRAGMGRAFASPSGLLGVAGVAGVLAAGVVLAAVRIVGAPRDAEWLEAASARVPATYPRLDRALPEIAGLVDQRGDAFGWERVAGRPALLTFGFGHCATVCPMTVMNARQVQDRFRAEGREMDLVVITLDPWRDTPARLPSLARQFHLGGGGAGEGDAVRAEGGEDGAGSYLLSGAVEAVNAALDALQVARERVPDTGDIVHPALVYLLDGAGTIVYAASGHADLIEELARRM